MACAVTSLTEMRALSAERDDPDIAGIGVIIGFMLSAYVTLILVIIHYLFDYKNTQNPIDRAWIKFLTPKSWNNPQGRPSKKWSQALESAVLLYSDSQVLTGIAILLCTYSQLRHGISVYHWQMAVKLAWFSSVTHLTTLTSLRAYFRNRPVMAFWRVVFMGVTLLLLMIALIPTDYTSDLPLYNDIPAACLYSKGYLFPNFNRPLIASSLIILLTSYVTRVVKFFTPLSSLAHKLLRVAPGNLLKKYFILTKRQRDNDASRALEKTTWASLQWFFILAYVLFKAIYDIGESMLWEMIWLLMALAWGTIRLLTKINWNDASGEMGWRFGQFMAIMLSTFPLWSIYTKLQEIEYEESRRARLISTSPIPTSSTLASQQPLAHLKLYQSAWFPKLIILMFALALGIAASVLYFLPVEPVLVNNLGMLSASYSFSLMLFTLVLVVFISICLAAQFSNLRLPSWLGGWKRSFEELDDQKKLIIQRSLWTTFIISLLAALIWIDMFLVNKLFIDGLLFTYGLEHYV